MDETSPRPSSDSDEEWRAFWVLQGMAWRTEPELGEERQGYLGTLLLAETASASPEMSPLDGVRLSRADVEWLLSRYHRDERRSSGIRKPGVGPDQLNLGGADLHRLDLKGLPLLEVNLLDADLHEANLDGADLRGAFLLQANLEGASLREARLDHASLSEACLSGANLYQASLRGADLENARLEGIFAAEVHLEGATLKEACLDCAFLQSAHLETANLEGASLHGTRLMDAHLEGANLHDVCLGGKRVPEEKLKQLRTWSGVMSVVGATVPPANLKRATFDKDTIFRPAIFRQDENPALWLADVRWNGASLALVRWSQIVRLGEERQARGLATEYGYGVAQTRLTRLYEFETAVRAYRQLASALREQGLSEQGDYFAYRAQVLQRHVFWLAAVWGGDDSQLRYELYCGDGSEDVAYVFDTNLAHHGRFEWAQRLRRRVNKLAAAGFSLLLDAMSGHGYRPLRTLLWYLAVIGSFAFAYYWLGPSVGVPLPPLGAIVFSVTSFHGRGFFPGGSPGHSVTLDDPLTVLAAAEAVLGLFIEVSFIATFTQRYFGK